MDLDFRKGATITSRLGCCTKRDHNRRGKLSREYWHNRELISQAEIIPFLNVTLKKSLIEQNSIQSNGKNVAKNGLGCITCHKSQTTFLNYFMVFNV